MIDIFSLTDKNGKKLCELRSSKNNESMYSSNYALLSLPDIRFSYEKKFSYQYGVGDDYGIDGELMGDDYYLVTDYSAFYIKIGDTRDRIWFGTEGDYLDSEDDVRTKFSGHSDLTKQDINKAMRAAFAYKYMTEHIQERLVNGRSTSELMNLPYMDVVQLERAKNRAYHDFKDEIRASLYHRESDEDTAQALLDKTFGAGTVNLDEYITSQITSQLEKQDEIAQRKAESALSISKIKAGFAKLLTPVRMLSQRISEKNLRKELKSMALADKSKSKESSDWEISRKASILEESFSDIL